MVGTSDADVAVVFDAQDMFDGRRNYSDSEDTPGGGDVLEARGDAAKSEGLSRREWRRVTLEADLKSDARWLHAGGADGERAGSFE